MASCVVRILDIEIDNILTAAFHDPRSWLDGQNCTDYPTDRNIYHDSILTRPNKALYLTEVFDCGRACFVLTFAMLTVLVSGIIVGFAYHSIEMGLAVTGAMSGWLSCVEFLLLKQYSQR